MNWKCEKAKQWIAQYCDDDLIEEDHLRLEEHISQCASCRTLFHGFRESWKLLDTYSAIDPSESFVRSTMDLVHAEKAAERPRKIARAVVLLAASIIIVLSLILYPNLDGPEDSYQLSNLDEDIMMDLELIEDLEFLEQFGEDLELAFEYDLYNILEEEGND